MNLVFKYVSWLSKRNYFNQNMYLVRSRSSVESLKEITRPQLIHMKFEVFIFVSHETFRFTNSNIENYKKVSNFLFRFFVIKKMKE